MAQAPFDAMPDEARTWVFAASDPLDAAHGETLLAAVDEYLAQWSAHGVPLTCARDWRDARFLAVAVDPRAAGASGCSIDALFRILQQLERSLGTTLVAGGRIFYRDATGTIQRTDRASYAALARAGVVAGDTVVFDTAVTTAGDWRHRFERPASTSWHAQLA